jgi:hypothetical protein
MRWPKLHIYVSTVLTMLVGSALKSTAGEPIYFMTHRGQDALVLGTVVSVDQQSVQFQPKVVVSGQPLQSTVLVQYPTATRLPLKTGDLVLLPLNHDQNAYKLAGGISKVSSLNPQTLKILDSDFLLSDRLVLQWYVNSCGQAEDFSQSGSSLFVRHADEKQFLIAQKRNGKWMPLRKTSLYDQACNQLWIRNQASPRSSWLIGAVAGMGVAVALTYGGVRLAKRHMPSESGETGL